MAGQPSAPEDHAATLLQAEPRSHDTVFMVRVQRRFRSWGLMVRSLPKRASRTIRGRGLSQSLSAKAKGRQIALPPSSKRLRKKLT